MPADGPGSVSVNNKCSLHVDIGKPVLNPKVDIPLFATNANPLQLYHSLRAKPLAFKIQLKGLKFCCPTFINAHCQAATNLV